MMKKMAFILILIVTASVSLLLQIDWNRESFGDILKADPDDVTKIELSLSGNNHYKSARDYERIQMVFDYMESRTYQNIRGEPSELSMSANTLYIDTEGKKHFIVIAENKIMVNHQFYEVQNKSLDLNHLKTIYLALD